ncbi:MoaA/NifB/PqqE/SkfB family radical SAM enzyme [Thermocatellispora tengchongensis]|uniref:MoaA/NifB/PqqE/SkfB family radical SAM enzyme n=1 Tax=Thermocatellispora tengchongensis TaxID=1073253 RepID=A0A840PJ48_9ACTN|nr:radical SAM protein [Thermocatellispora tengchongensis]MBB5136095.1 MoaA/NifB/PqqE/SkfB family radical SAM enzyme [Thermocatellispora tengchongensis]
MTLTQVRTLGTDRIERNLDLVGKLYQRSIYPSVEAVAHGRRPAAPVVVDLDPTTLCDLACPECISAGVLHKGGLSRDRIVELAHELAGSGVRAVILIGGGEPLMHRSIGDVITVLHQAGVQVGLVTNGTLIGRYLDEIAEMVSWTRVSVDAATMETYDRFRPSRRKTSVFPLILDNMRALAERKRGALGYSFLLMQRRDAAGAVTETNYHEVYAAGRLAKELGCDYFELKAMLDENHFTVNQSPADIALVEEQLARLRELEDGSFHLLGSSNWEAVHHDLDPVQPKEYSTCHVAELRTTVTPNGVYVCPYHRGNEKAKIGDINAMSFAEMWAKADTTVVNPRADCRFHCARHRANLDIAALPRRGRPVELLDDFDPFI